MKNRPSIIKLIALSLLGLWVTIYNLVLITFSWYSVFIIVNSLPNGTKYSTTDISEYGNITGNHDDDRAKEEIFEIFPEKIEDSFSDVSYYYNTEWLYDELLFECYLEFVIEDKAEYDSFVADYTSRLQKVDNPCAEGYETYSNDKLSFNLWYSETTGDIHMKYSRMKHVAFSESEQRVVFVALLYTHTDSRNIYDFDYYFKRFDLNPVEYATTLRASFIGETGKKDSERYEGEDPYGDYLKDLEAREQQK